MWLRIIGKIGGSNSVVLPAQLMNGIGWRRGDHVQLSILAPNKVLITKLDVENLKDAVRQALEELPTIKYE